MDYIKNTFERMDLQYIQQYLLYGVQDITNDKRKYKDKLKFESEPIYNRLQSIYPDEDERDKATADLSQALAAYEAVYMEIGMKAGARIVHQLLLNDEG